MSDDIITSPRLAELLRMRRFLDTEIAEERRRLDLGDAANLIRAAADLYGTTVEAIHSTGRDRTVSSARMVTCWLLHEHGMSYPEIARALGIHHTSALNACRVIDNDPTRLAIARRLLAQEVAA